MIRIQSFTESAALPYLSSLAVLRISVFKEFPYLYEGTLEYEMQYLQTFFNAPKSIIVIAFDGDKVVGASTGLPLAYETTNLQVPWQKLGFDIEHIFYFSESVLLQPYRGQGIGKHFFAAREAWAVALKKFQYITFCAVVRPFDHVKKPVNYQHLDSFWQQRGFKKKEHCIAQMSWQDLDKTFTTAKPMQFWWKEIGV